MLIAVEDALSEAVAYRLLASTPSKNLVAQSLPAKGKSYLKEKAENLNRAAKGQPVFLLTDLDDPKSCPAELTQSWLKSPRSDNLIFRVAVLAVESWVMADREAFAKFLSIPLERIPSDPDTVPRPKEFLVSLARLSRSSRLRRELVPSPGATSKVGPAYNAHLIDFVRKRWNPEAAAAVSGSLRRTLERLRGFDVTDG